MKLPGPKLPQLHLQPGELMVTREPQWIITLLGSCVAVTMFNHRLRLAAICHGMLPQPRSHSKESAGSHSREHFRFLSHAIPSMIDHYLRAGIKPEGIEVKMFGGGNVINLGGDPSGERWIGSANIAAAKRLLAAASLRVKAENIGGERGRKIVFNTHTGEVLHKLLSSKSHSA